VNWPDKATAWGSLLSPIATITTVIVALMALQSATDTSAKQQHLAEQGQITDRFSKAIDQLGQAGDGKLAIRLGGIYALERIMWDAPVDERDPVDERNIVELLCAFIRASAAVPYGPKSEETGWFQPATDVQAALTVLGRRPNFNKPGFGTDPEFGVLDLRRTRLDGARLEGAHLEGAHFEGAHLNGAHFGAVVDGKYGNGAVLSGAYLTGADLTAAHLEDSYIGPDTNLDGANLTGAQLNGAHLGTVEDGKKHGADLSSTTGLTSKNLRCAFVEGDTKFPTGVSVDRSSC